MAIPDLYIGDHRMLPSEHIAGNPSFGKEGKIKATNLQPYRRNKASQSAALLEASFTLFFQKCLIILLRTYRILFFIDT
jgi:hypothetical protein